MQSVSESIRATTPSSRCTRSVMDTQPWTTGSGRAKTKGRAGDLLRAGEGARAQSSPPGRSTSTSTRSSFDEGRARAAARATAGRVDPGLAHRAHAGPHLLPPRMYGSRWKSTTPRWPSTSSTSRPRPRTHVQSAYYPHNIHFVLFLRRWVARPDRDRCRAQARRSLTDTAVSQFAALEPIKPRLTWRMRCSARPTHPALQAPPKEQVVCPHWRTTHARSPLRPRGHDRAGARSTLSPRSSRRRTSALQRPAVPQGDRADRAAVASARLADAQGNLRGSEAYEEAIAIEDALAYMSRRIVLPDRQSLAPSTCAGQARRGGEALRDSLAACAATAGRWLAWRGLQAQGRREGEARASAYARPARRRGARHRPVVRATSQAKRISVCPARSPNGDQSSIGGSRSEAPMQRQEMERSRLIVQSGLLL